MIAAKSTASISRPNVIWVLGDQHRAQALGCNGDPNVHTPNIDILAAMGVNFTSAISGFPLCGPFRGSMLTGRYPHHCVPGNEHRLPEELPTIATVFNAAGYHTAYIGKWHLDGFHEHDGFCTTGGRAAMHQIPPERRGGFQYWLGYENNNSQWDSWVHGGDGKIERHYRLHGFETDALTDLLIEYLKARGAERQQGRGQPFFAVLTVQPPHEPYVAPAEFMGRHTPGDIRLRPNVPPVPQVVEQARRGLAGYYAMIENLDFNLGRLRKALAEAGLAFGTHLVFFSDHGDMHGSHGQFQKTHPYQESLGIPFIIGGEEPLYNGRKRGRFPVLLNHVDIAPTTLGLCNIDKPEWMEGTDYSHYRLAWRAGDSEPDSAYLQQVVAPTTNKQSVDKPWRGLITNDGWKYVCFEGYAWLMCNLNEDPYEQVNLAHNPAFAEQRQRLNERLRQWIDATGDRFALPGH